MASVHGAFPSSDPRHERQAADQRPRSRPLRGPPVPGLKAKYWRLKRTRPARWAAGRVASTRSHSDSELRRTSVTRTCFRMAVVNRLHSNCRPPIPANAACNFEPSSSPGSKPSTIGVVGQQEIDRRVGGGAIPANQRDHRVDVPGDESLDTRAEARIPLRFNHIHCLGRCAVVDLNVKRILGRCG